MNVLQHVLRIGIIYVAICCLSPILSLFGGLILILLKANRYQKSYRRVLTLCNVTTFYVLVSLIGILTIVTYQQNHSVAWLILFSVIGTLAVFWIGTKTVYEKRKGGDYQKEEDLYGYSPQLRNDSILSLAAPLLFIAILFVPAIAFNPVTSWLFHIIEWAYNLRFIGWLLGIGGILIMLAMFEDGFFAVFAAIILAFSSIRAMIRTENRIR